MQHHDKPSSEEQRTSLCGRHRRGARAGRRARRVPSFRTTVTLAGTATVVLTVATGAYVASLGSPSGTATRSDEVALTNLAPLIARSAPPPAGSPTAPATPSGAGAAPPEAAPSAAQSLAPSVAPSPSGSLPPAPAPAKVADPAVDPAARPVGGGKVARYIDEVVALANTEREKAGCARLRPDARLRESAQAHADDMADRDYYDHNSPEGRDAGDRIKAAGYPWASWAENIHRGPKTPAKVMDDWMSSAGHRRNILNCSLKDIGVGVTLTADGPWWVQNFGTRR
ncbi:CAP domain-containing protein [Streptomyces sp. NPDC090127]|uniref:CAP domain-containing protein n=1 Tax=Streptomyces sp. NPDC090127 TaxID=3365953 RepID=UPI0038001B72